MREKRSSIFKVRGLPVTSGLNVCIEPTLLSWFSVMVLTACLLSHTWYDGKDGSPLGPCLMRAPIAQGAARLSRCPHSLAVNIACSQCAHEHSSFIKQHALYDA
jgi:hypothetical protein